MISRLAWLAADARRTTKGLGNPRDLAAAARWIAANALAARGVEVKLTGTVPRTASVLGLRAQCFAQVTAAIATVPVLIDASEIPAHWRMALRALGVPVLDRSVARALAGGASVLSLTGIGGAELRVDPDHRGFHVTLPS